MEVIASCLAEQGTLHRAPSTEYQISRVHMDRRASSWPSGADAEDPCSVHSSHSREEKLQCHHHIRENQRIRRMIDEVVRVLVAAVVGGGSYDENDGLKPYVRRSARSSSFKLVLRCLPVQKVMV
jgi:hypothetical protein